MLHTPYYNKYGDTMCAIKWLSQLYQTLYVIALAQDISAMTMLSLGLVPRTARSPGRLSTLVNKNDGVTH